MTSCAVARTTLAQHVAGLADQSFSGQLGTAIKTIGYLGTMTSGEKHVVSLAAGSPVALVTNANAAMGDYLASLVSPLRPRTTAFVATPTGLKLGAKAFARGMGDFLRAMRAGADPDKVGDAFNLQGVKLPHPMLEIPRRYIDTFVTARNKPFYEAAMQLSLYRQARVMAMNEGLTGARASARVNDLLTNSTPTMAMNAMADAREYTFSAPTIVDKGVNALRRGLTEATAGARPPTSFERARAQAVSEGLTGDQISERAAKLMSLKPAEFERQVTVPKTASSEENIRGRGQAVLAKGALLGIDIAAPFPRVMSNIGGTAIDYSPWGIVKNSAQAFGQLPADRVAFINKAFSKAAIGTAAGFAGGYVLAANGLMTGPKPTNSALTGAGPYVMRLPRFDFLGIHFGDTWHDMSVYAPWFMMPVLGAAFYDESKRHPGELLANFGRASGEQLKVIGESSILQAMGQIGNLFGDPHAASAAASRLVPIPPLLGQVARGTDTVKDRDVSAPTFGGQVVNQLKSRIPGLRETLPVKPNAFGQVPKSEGLASALLDPTRPAADRTTAVTQELDRLGISLKNPQGKMTRGPISIQLTPQEKLEGVESMGPDLERRLTALMASPSYASASDQLKAREVKRLVSLTHRVGMLPQFERAYQQGQAVRAR